MTTTKRSSKARTASFAKGHLGTVGKRQDFGAAEVVSAREIEGRYGCTTVLTLRAESGHCITWFASGSKRLEPGTLVTVTGTVKAHGDFREVDQTVLTRCRLEEVEATQG